MSVVAIARWTLARSSTLAGPGASTLVGVGQNAHAALVVAAGGFCDRVAVVDGLWRPWRTPAEEVDGLYDMIRAVASDPGATGRAQESGLDPRATHGYGVMSSARFSQYFWAAIDQPVLAIETPRSTTPRDERAERLAWFGGPATIVELESAEPSSVVAAIEAWR
jgi:hypothetical protein